MTNWYGEVRELNQQRIPAATVTVIKGGEVGAKLVVSGKGTLGSLGSKDLDAIGQELAMAAIDTDQSRVIETEDGISLFVENFPVAPQLVIVGAVHVAQALIPVARSLGYYIAVVDARASLATPERFPDVDELHVAWPDEAFPKLNINRKTAIAILTHDPKFDEPAILGALQTDAFYIGAIGSRKTNADRRNRLKAAGATDEQLSRVHGPIGLDIGGKLPEEMAISIMAEILAVRYQRSGQSMSRK